jgi:formylglycine-generating enzyme required for sulfatase activity
MRCNLMAWVVCIVAALGLSGCYDDIDIENLCHPDDPECADLDWDGDGVANAVDDFPTDDACSLRDDDNCSACGAGCPTAAYCTEGGACVCSDPMYTGASCEFRIIESGSFSMGSPYSEPCRDDMEVQYQVTLTRSFSLKATEVTQAEWQALMGNNPSQNSPGCDECPVEMVNWYEALSYCNALSASVGLKACYTLSGCNGQSAGTGMECAGVTITALDGDVYGCEGYRLPTEAEWEYAARAGTTTATYNGDIAVEDCYSASPVLEPIAWYSENSSSITHPFAKRQPNAWGLYDMLGNVWEWAWDLHDSYGEYVTDPVDSSSGLYRAYRGCSWYTAAHQCRAAFRIRDVPETRSERLGFRPARTIFE